MSNNKRILFKITNLKQYFPLKKKGLAVKANDGIDLHIYEGETLGLVGESGCGKSTLGRTMLQLYRQTDGRTMYYGRTLLDVAPDYMKRTILNLEQGRNKLHQLREELKKSETAYAAMDQEEQFRAATPLQDLKRRVHDADLDITNIIGGLIVASDLAPVKAAYLKMYQAALERRQLNSRLFVLKTDLDDAQYRAEHGKRGAQAAADKTKSKITELEIQWKSADDEVASVQQEISKLRDLYANDADFQQEDQKLDEGVDLARLTYNEMRHLRVDMQLIFQDPYSSLDSRMTVGQIVGEGLLTHQFFRRNDDRMKEYVLKVMDDCGLAPYFLHRYPHQFSGGQRQRIGIARALAPNPRFVVCDEAVSALDVSIQSQIINLLQELKEQQNLTYLFITHDLSVVKYISDRIAVMYLGVIVELAPSQDIFSCPMHPYTEALLSAIPTADENVTRELVVLEGDIPSPVNAPPGCKFHTRCKYATEVCRHVVPQLEEVQPDHFVACHHRLGAQQP
ncbi:MAG: oligopeptide/dipeptide ABC transporter ATP-binding protein [Christensenellales bacterium]|jgi:peptide/nickel transport system ATP-binding protein